MLKKIVTVSVMSLMINQISFASIFKQDALNLAGTYQCYGHDSHDGGYKNAIVTLTLDSKNSDVAHNYGAYLFSLKESTGKIQYVGEVAASGNNLAIHFANTDAKATTDHGVGIAVVTHDKDINGKVTTVFHKFYYEPSYQGGGNGSETCIKEER